MVLSKGVRPGPPGFLAALLLISLPAVAQVRWEARHAAGGIHRPGNFIPVAVWVENTSESDLTIELCGKGGTTETRHRLDLPRKVRKELTLYLGQSGGQASYRIELLIPGNRFRSEATVTSTALLPNRILVGLVGDHPMGWTDLRDEKDSPVTLAFLKAPLLPDRLAGLDSLDVIVWPNADLARVRPETISAIKTWVELGGVLVLPAGSILEGMQAGALRSFTAVEPAGLRSSTSLPGTAKALLTKSTSLAGPSPLVSLRSSTGTAWLRETEGAIGIEEQRGRGKVVVLGLDPTHPGLAGWPGLPLLWKQLLGRAFPSFTRAGSEGPSSPTSWLMREEAQGSTGAGMSRPGLFLFTLIYLLAIGPLDYLILKRMKRLSWTWLTFPVLLLVFSGSAALLASRTLPVGATIRYISFCDVLPGLDQLVQTTHFRSFSVKAGTAKVTSGSCSIAQGAWDGDPHSRMPGTPVFHAEDGMLELRTPPRSWSTGVFTSVVLGRGASVTARLDLTETTLSGELTPNLGKDVTDAYVVAFHTRPLLFRVGPLKNGQRAAIRTTADRAVTRAYSNGEALSWALETAFRSARSNGTAGAGSAFLLAEAPDDSAPVLAGVENQRSEGKVVFRVAIPLDSVPQEEPLQPALTVWLPGKVPLQMAGILPTISMQDPGEPFYIGKFEVTLEQWMAVVGRAPVPCTSEGVTGPSSDPKAPVTCVSVRDVEGPGGFIDLLHAHLKSSGQAGEGKYRLPTKGEWRYSACANTTERFFFGDALSCPWTCDPCPAAEPFVWWCGNSKGSLHPVGLKRANPFGLFDILGNAEEVTHELPPGNVGAYSTTVQTGSVASTLGECMNEKQFWDSAVSPVTGFRLARYR